MKKIWTKIVIGILSILFIFISISCPVIGTEFFEIEIIKEEILETAGKTLPPEELAVLESIIASASSSELSDLNDAIQRFDQIAEKYHLASLIPARSLSASENNSQDKTSNRALLLSAINYALQKAVGFFDSESFPENLQAFFDLGLGFSRGILDGKGVSGGLSAAYVGGYVEIEKGTGVGEKFDFRNFTKYSYDTWFASGSAGVSVGLDGTPISISGAISSIQVDSIIFNLEQAQAYEASPSVGVGKTIGVEASYFNGLGFSVSGMLFNSKNGDWTPDDLPTLPSGSSSGESTISLATNVKSSLGMQTGLMGSLGVTTALNYDEPINSTIYRYIDNPNPTRQQLTYAGYEMASDLLESGGVTSSNLVSLVSAGTAILYGLYYDSGASPTPVSSFSYCIINGNEIEITGFIGDEIEVVIPMYIDGKPVTSIGDDAFSYCTSLTSISIPSGITSIGEGAFNKCTSLLSITIPEGVTSIEFCTFQFCNSLSSITIPSSITSIGTLAFSQCTSLTSITIPDSVTSIGSWAFQLCTSLPSITIPDSVTTIGGFAFAHCTSLLSITIPNSVTSIETYAFYHCDSLTDIYCEAASQPAGWVTGWDKYEFNEYCYATVHWGYTGD